MDAGIVIRFILFHRQDLIYGGRGIRIEFRDPDGILLHILLGDRERNGHIRQIVFQSAGFQLEIAGHVGVRMLWDLTRSLHCDGGPGQRIGRAKHRSSTRKHQRLGPVLRSAMFFYVRFVL